MDTIQEILKNWNIPSRECVQKTPSIWMIGNEYILKAYDNIDVIDRNVKMLLTLINLGIPVAQIIHTNDDNSYVTHLNHYYLLMKKLPGEHIKDIKEENIGFKIGKAIGQLHIALNQCENILQLQEKDLLSDLKGWVKDNFEKNLWKLFDKNDYFNFICRLQSFYNELPRQLIHRDVHLGNFLFLNGQFTGYIDFDLSQKNIRIFDLCYFLTSLFTEKDYKNLTDDKWLKFLKETVFGYETQIKLTNKEKLAFPLIMEGIELLCASFFIGINNEKLINESLNNYQRVKRLEDSILEEIKC